jgi:zinc protease
MKTRLLMACALALATLTGPSAPAAFGQATSWRKIPIPPLPAFHPQEPKRILLPNGMVIFLQEDHELPLIDGVARIRGGSRSVPADKTGLMDIYGEVWRTGGTKAKTGDQLDDFLEIRAARVETEASADSTTISLSCLKGDFDEVFQVFNDLLRNPEFRADKIDIARKGEDDAISRRNDDPSDIASRISTQLGYGKENPYARDPEYATVAAITRQDLIDWHNAHVHPNDIILGLVGDFDSTAMEAKLRQAFGSWERGPETKTPDIAFDPAKPGYYFVSKTDVNQSNIRMVELGIRRDNPDLYAVEVFDEAFGGGFASRLFRNIRTQQGLAYEVAGGIGTAFDHDGMVRIVIATKSGSTVKSIKAIYDQIDELKTHPITEEEIKQAKDSILNSFVFNFDTPDKVLHERMAYEFYGYPSDFLEKYRAGIEKVTPADVARIIPKYLHKDRLKVLVVGNAADFDQPLSSLGPVSDVDISIPPPPGAKAEAKPTASNPEGKELIGKVVEAMGGEAKLQSIKSLQEDISSTQKTPQGDMAMSLKTTIVFPDRIHASVQGPMGAFTLVATPAEAFVVVPGRGVQDLPESRRDETLEQVKRDLIYIGQHADDPAFVFAAAGSEKIGDVEAKILEIGGEDVNLRWYVDPQSGHVLRETYQTVGRSGPVEGETDLEDWKTADGLTLPYTHKNKQNGEDSSTAQYSAIQLNPAVDPKLFDKPAAETQKPQ